MSETIVIDATETVLGRLASHAAKAALLGKSVVVVNCSNALITGNYSVTVGKYKEMRSRGKGNQRGPTVPKVAEKLVKRTIRGMLPHLQTRGIEALKRVRCYDDVPDEYKDAKKLSFVRELRVKSLKMSDLLRRI